MHYLKKKIQTFWLNINPYVNNLNKVFEVFWTLQTLSVLFHTVTTRKFREANQRI